MNRHFIRAVETLFDEYSRFWQCGEHYSALTSLAEIHHCLHLLPPSLTRRWEEITRERSLPDEIVRQVGTEARETLRNIRRIVSIGTRFVDEEIMLVLVKRVQAEILSDLLLEVYGVDLDLDLAGADADIERVRGIRNNKPLFASVAREMKRNWNLPIRNIWLQ